jgi:hypothetical protein
VASEPTRNSSVRAKLANCVACQSHACLEQGFDRKACRMVAASSEYQAAVVCICTRVPAATRTWSTMLYAQGDQGEQVRLSAATVLHPRRHATAKAQNSRAWHCDYTRSVSASDDRFSGKPTPRSPSHGGNNARRLRPRRPPLLDGPLGVLFGVQHRRRSWASRAGRYGLAAGCEHRETVVLRPLKRTEKAAGKSRGNQKCSFQSDLFHSNLPCS